LIRHFADSAGKKGGEFYTPRDVARLMVRLLKPQQKMRIYDPCVDSGGMLILSKQYLEESQRNANAKDLSLYGQEANGGVWAICKMNMILHGIPDAFIENDDTLANPLHKEGGELMRFDRVSCCVFNLYTGSGQDARTTMILRFCVIQLSCTSA